MINNYLFSKIWNEYGLEFLAGISILIIFILYLINLSTKKQGTYTCVKSLSFPTGTETNLYPKEFNYKEHNNKDSKLEVKAKLILEYIFKRPFVKIRPDFLRNEVTGYNLEIDLYNDDLKLGVEINGDQHYKFIPFFHRNKDQFVKQRYRDEMKKMKCQKQGITLIEVPYSVGENGLKSYLVDQLRIEGFLV